MKAQRSHVTRAALWLALNASLFLAPVHAQTPVAPEPDLPAPVAPEPDLQALINGADQADRIHLLVGVRADFVPEGYLNANEVAQQRSAIAQAQYELLLALPSGSYTVKYQYETTPYIALAVNVSALPTLLNSPQLQSVIEDAYVPLALTQSGPLVGSTNAAAMGYTGGGQTVAILDTGVDKNHNHLAGKVVSEACYSSSTSGYTSLCPGGGTGSTAPGSGVPCNNGSGTCFHGTHVAGIVAANGGTVKGIARDATLISIQVFSRRSSDGAVLAQFSDIKSGLDRVAALRTSFDIAAANMSLGTFDTYPSACDSNFPSLASSINQLKSFDIATVIASGNSSSSTGISFPACISNAISVGNTTKSDAISSSSNSAAILDLLAPGTSIYSAVPGGGFSTASGTSMAAPHVAGAWAILHALTRPVDNILAKLVQTGVPITDARNQVTKKRIRADQAALAVEDPTPNPFTFVDVAFVPRNTPQTSNAVSISGINTAVSVSVSGGSYSKNNGPWTTATGTSVSGDSFRVQHTSASTPSTSVTTTLTVGGVSDAFTSTTEPVLASFSAASQNVTEGTGSNPTVTVTVNLSAAAANTVTVPFSVGGTAGNPADHSAGNGSVTLPAGQTSATTSFTVVGDALDEVNETVVLTMGTPTNASRVPDSFAFTPAYDVGQGTTQFSNLITIGGTAATVKVTVTGGSYSKNGGAYVTAAGSAAAGDTFRLRHTASSVYGDSASTTLTVGGVSGTFTSYTEMEPPCPGWPNCIPP